LFSPYLDINPTESRPTSVASNTRGRLSLIAQEQFESWRIGPLSAVSELPDSLIFGAADRERNAPPDAADGRAALA